MTIRNKKKFFYGWVIVGVCSLLMFLNAGCAFYAFGIFLKPIAADIGCTRGEVSIALAILMIFSAIPAPVVAVAISKYGARKLIIFSMILFAIGLALLSTIIQLWQLWLFSGIVGMAIAFGIFLPITTTINFWFVRRRAFAMGITMSSVGIGTIVLAPIIAHLIDIIGWRPTWLVLAVIVLILGVIPSLIFFRNKPGDIGEVPDGISHSVLKEQSVHPPVKKTYITPVEWEVRAALKTKTLWLIMIVAFTNIFALSMSNAHLVSYFNDIGLSSVVAAGSLGLLIGISTLGRLVGGYLGDRIEPRYLIALACSMEAIGFPILINLQNIGLVYLYIYIVLFGIGVGIILVLQPVILAAYYGTKGFSRLIAIVMVILVPVGAISPVFGGYVYDAVHSYTIPFGICAGLCILGAICALLAQPPPPPHIKLLDKPKYFS